VTRRRLALAAGCVCLGVLGAVLGFITWHLWQDHVLLHNMHSFLTNHR